MREAAKAPSPGLEAFESVEDDAPSAEPDGDLIREPHDVAAVLPGLLPGTNPVEHERDILLVVGSALGEGGVSTMSEFRAWLERQTVNLMRSGITLRDTGKFPDPEPVIVKLARHLREQRSVFRK